eukprot:TRINITY_DN26720_c0_g1_i1.p1 TRINITY_DN26720_c0_g1~~TRINITY_DN26720_c0_g1_i1.p1  ORF type:complete len:412 (+),score=89.15 TRINITY_DN26720_c0_g1_i1:67-1302(+)
MMDVEPEQLPLFTRTDSPPPRPHHHRTVLSPSLAVCIAVATAVALAGAAWSVCSLTHKPVRRAAASPAAAGKLQARGVEFLSVGDWGDSGVRAVAQQMSRHSPSFVFGLGDNFYNSGVRHPGDSRRVDAQFEHRFERMFSSPTLSEAPWYVCAGNHDYYGGEAGVLAEIEYSRRSKRWVYPDFYFNRTVTDPRTGMTVLIVSIDTWRLNGGDTYVEWGPRGGRLRSSLVRRHLAEGKIARDTHDQLVSMFVDGDRGGVEERGKKHAHKAADRPVDEQQIEWLATVLSESNAHWKLVLGHFAVHSAAARAHGDTPSLVERVQPIFEQYGVDAYFSGHDHILQIIETNGVSYYGSGAGARSHKGVVRGYPGLARYADGVLGYMSHYLTREHLYTVAYDQSGSLLFDHTLVKQK